MTNHTNVDGNTNDNLSFKDPAAILLMIMVFLIFISTYMWFQQLCLNSKNWFYHSHRNRVIDPEVRYDSDSDYEIEKVDDNVLEIKKIPTFANVNNYPMYCSICQEEQLNTVRVDCGHNFCKECIIGYTKVGNECPNCREDIQYIYEIEVLTFK